MSLAFPTPTSGAKLHAGTMYSRPATIVIHIYLDFLVLRNRILGGAGELMLEVSDMYSTKQFHTRFISDNQLDFCHMHGDGEACVHVVVV